ncbi:class I SAM-dependent DNA methyltransferase [Pseudonocardia sulfidoxydans]|uniref:HsdM family class I SAM-dependent methyltransferase n=1 Tax=Pseudonocardia sulfidoxydans TaxID=54011 RepID=UPI0011BDBD68|nr:Eco57I restriction-modification methylase domain-containing protein [Pseudonocardia sulfidoxydans]
MASDLQLPPLTPRDFGEVFTRRWVVDALLDAANYKCNRDLVQLRLTEPACGTGAFLVPAVERLVASLRDQELSEEVVVQLHSSISAWDIQASSIESCRSALRPILAALPIPEVAIESILESWLNTGDYLLAEHADTETSDVVIGNPPYLRLEDVAPQVQKQYRSRWKTMTGRADIYVGFFERGLTALRPNGTLAFICADRWMRNQYGASLRKMITESYSVDATWELHDVDAFESTVSAYPAITVISRRHQGSVVVAEAMKDFNSCDAEILTRWTTQGDQSKLDEGRFHAFRLPHWFSGDDLWPTGSPERLAMIEYLSDNFAPLNDATTGTRVGIGVASGADKVFVTENHSVAEPDRMLPLATVKDLKTGQLEWSGRYLVNPWDSDGTLVELDDHPKLKHYFLKNEAALRNRFIARNGRCWYQTIDKVNHGLSSQSKLLIQDMRSSINPVLDPGKLYPHHNLYYIISGTWDLEVLGGILISQIAQSFIEAYSVRMRGDTLRFQAQYLRNVRVPNFTQINDQVREELRNAFRSRDTIAATRASMAAYGLKTGDFGLA